MEAVNLREIGARHKSSKTERHQLFSRIFLETVVFPFTLALLLAFAMSLTEAKWLGPVSLGALAISYIGILVFPLIALMIHRASVWKALKNPFTFILANAKATAKIDQNYISALYGRSEAELQFLKLELDSERAAFEKRLSLVAGTVEKIGILPGFLAIAVVMARLGNQQPDWVYAVAYATPVIYVIGAMSHFLLMRLERQVKLIDLVLDLKTSSSNK
jgi:hypothetical protein